MTDLQMCLEFALDAADAAGYPADDPLLVQIREGIERERNKAQEVSNANA